MSLLLRVKALATAIGADIKAINAKLTGVATGATKNATDAQLRDRATHTGIQPHTTITGLVPATTFNVGGAPTIMAERAATFMIVDSRSAVSEPVNVPAASGLFEFKFNTAVGNPPGPSNYMYSHILTTNGWTADGTGGWPTQISFGEELAYRKGSSKTSWRPWKKLYDSENTLNIGKTAVTARAAMGLNVFEDASGVLTKTSGALSNDMSSFLSSLTYAQMKTKLGGPTWAEVTGKPATYPSNWDNVASKPEQATRWPTWDEVTGKPDVGGGGGGFTTAPVYVPAFNIDPVDAIDHGVSAPAIVSPSKKVGVFATDSKVVLFNTTTSPHGYGDSANVEVSPAVVQMSAENSVAGIFAGIFITSEGIIISGITNTDGDIVSTTDTGSVSLQDLAARVAALEARS